MRLQDTWKAGWMVALCASIGMSCKSSGAPSAPAQQTTFPAANAYAPDNPLFEGQWHFQYDTWGTEDLQGWPPVEFMLGLMKSEPDVFGNQYAAFGFIPDPNDDFPVGFKRGIVNPDKVGQTCAICHTSQLPDGRVWFGVPAEHLDLGRFSIEVNKRWVAAGNAPLFGDLSLMKMAGLGPGRTNAEPSNYPQLVGADFPPFFGLQQRTHLNYLGTGGNTKAEAAMAIYAFGAGSPDDADAKVPFPGDDSLNPLVNFISSLEAPAGPAADAKLVATGAMVFQTANCGSCHHVADGSQDGVTTADGAPDTMERLPGQDSAFPRGSINTDPMHYQLESSSSSADGGTGGYDQLIQFIAKHELFERGSDGYCVRTLHGLWSTAPYLHNGSVPTLQDLLDPAAQRPKTWQNMSSVFDTTAPGNSNQGHEFGTSLSPSDKAALIAYLNTL